MGFPFFFLFLFYAIFNNYPISAYGASSSSPPLTQIPRDLYHSSYALLKDVEQLMETLRAQNKGYAGDIAVVTCGNLEKQTNNGSKIRILLSFGQHGRELITPELALHLLSVLSGEIRVSGLSKVSLDNILDNVVIKVVPMENRNGRKLVEAGDQCDRRNGRGVDLNRNWSVDWGKKEKYTPEWSQALFMPYDHKNATPDGYASKLMKSLLTNLNHHHFKDRCVVGSGGGTVGYFAHGTTTDYMYEVAKVPLAFTFEIYGDTSASSEDCFKMFNPVDSATFKRVLNEWCTALLALLETGPDQLKAHQTSLTEEDIGTRISVGGNVADGSLVGESRTSRKMMDGLELGMQELRTYFRLFLLSTVLLIFMFWSRISRSKCMETGSSI